MLLDHGLSLLRPLSSFLVLPDLPFLLVRLGQYFDLDDQLRVNYAHFWLSLISPNSAKIQAERRKYAKLVGNVGHDLYLILECESLPPSSHCRFEPHQVTDTASPFPKAALTGRIGLGAPNFDELPDEDATGLKKTYTQQKAGSVMDMETATEEEQSIMRNVSDISASARFEVEIETDASTVKLLSPLH